MSITTPRTLANALALVRITGWKAYLHSNTRAAISRYTLMNPDFVATGGSLYRLTSEGEALSERSPLWKAFQHVTGMGFEIEQARKVKPGHISFKHKDGDRQHCAFIGAKGHVYISPGKGDWNFKLQADYGFGDDAAPIARAA